MPESVTVAAPRYPHTPLSLWQLLGDGAASLFVSFPGFVDGALSDNSYLETLIMLWRRALGIMPVVEGDLILRAEKHQRDGQRVVQRGTFSDAKRGTSKQSVDLQIWWEWEVLI